MAIRMVPRAAIVCKARRYLPRMSQQCSVEVTHSENRNREQERDTGIIIQARRGDIILQHHHFLPATLARQRRQRLLSATTTFSGPWRPCGSSNRYPILIFSFAQALSYVEFEISPATNANSTAKLLAFDALGHQLGTTEIQTKGSGGNCSSLSAMIQLYKPQIALRSPYSVFFQ